jgi:hypothetical protein
VLLADLQDRVEYTAGRKGSGENFIAIPSREISRDHVRIRREAMGIVVTPLAFGGGHHPHSYGVYVEGHQGPLKPNESIFVSEGGRVGLGIIQQDENGRFSSTKDGVLITVGAEGKRLYSSSDLVDMAPPPKAKVDIAEDKGVPTRDADEPTLVVPLSPTDVYAAARGPRADDPVRPRGTDQAPAPTAGLQVPVPSAPGTTRVGAPAGLLFGGRWNKGFAVIIPRDGTVVKGPNGMKAWYNLTNNQYEYSMPGAATDAFQVGKKWVTSSPTFNGNGVLEDRFVFVELQGVRPPTRPGDSDTYVEDLQYQIRYQLAAAEIPHHLQELSSQGVVPSSTDRENLYAFFTPSFDQSLMSYDSGDLMRTQGGVAGGESKVFALVDPRTGKILNFANRASQSGGNQGERWEVVKNAQDGLYYWVEQKSRSWEPLQGLPPGAVVVPLTLDRMTGSLVTDPQALTQVGLSPQAWQKMTNLNGFVVGLGGSAAPQAVRYVGQSLRSSP